MDGTNFHDARSANGHYNEAFDASEEMSTTKIQNREEIKMRKMKRRQSFTRRLRSLNLVILYRKSGLSWTSVTTLTLYKLCLMPMQTILTKSSNNWWRRLVVCLFVRLEPQT